MITWQNRREHIAYLDITDVNPFDHHLLRSYGATGCRCLYWSGATHIETQGSCVTAIHRQDRGPSVD